MNERIGNGDTAPSKRDATLRVLASLDGCPPLDTLCGLANDRIADLLLDHHQDLTPSDFATGLEGVVLPWLDAQATRLCDQEYLLLDPLLLGDDALHRLLLQLAQGKRAWPFQRWARQTLALAISYARFDPTFALLQATEGSSDPERIRAALCRLLNEADTVVRRVLHMLFVRRMDAFATADANDLQVEEVEWIFDRILHAAMEIVAGRPLDDSNEVGSERFWRTMQEGSDDHDRA